MMAATLPVAVMASVVFAPAAASAVATPAGASTRLSHAAVAAHVDALQRIADANGGNRASGTPGYAASLDYVEGHLKQAGYQIERRPFSFLYTRVLEERLTLPGGEEAPVVLATYSPSTSERGLTARFAAVPGTEEQQQGCADSAYEGADVSGRIALVRNGGCGTDAKERAAAGAGAAAVIVINDVPGPVYGWLKDPEAARIPVAGVSSQTGEALVRAGQDDAPGTLVARSLTEPRTTENLIARMSAGDPEHQVISGAHVDSVPGTAGINDNGGAVALLLETALQRAERAERPRNQLVYAFWGAEEFDMLGSQHYVDSLSAAQRERIDVYLNLEMIGGANAGLFVMDGVDADPDSGLVPPEGSAVIADRFARAFAAAGQTAQTWKLDGRSDYAPFMKAGIPAGGLNGGSFELKSPEQAQLWGGTAGTPFDPCYHKLCDTAANFNAEIAGRHGEAFLSTLDHFADARPDDS
ncbi:M28 family peptidase [Streptomyces sp. NPDC052042]|uniref:M28 family peptidase n=1 Tax=Streptomyces sp. NPDC052042 TaxID=3365683 RepID=UPI0037CFA613